MKWQRIRRGGQYIVVMSALSLLAAGCVIRDPQALTDIAQSRKAIDNAKQAGAADRFPDEFAELEKRYGQARGTFYACKDKEASTLALALAADAGALASKRVMVAPPPPAPAPNRPPRAVMQVPANVEVNQLVRFFATDSSDPDGDKLTYQWSLGDGATSVRPDPTHIYTEPGNYTVQLMVSDGRGGEDEARRSVSVIRRVFLQETTERVLFDFDKASLKPAAKQALAIVLKDMREHAELRAEIVGHTDSRGPEAYNMRLSQRRAEAVRDYLVAQGIPVAYLSVEWRGEGEPVESNDTEKGRAQNRRVELTIRPVEQ